jgi:hypothetical protein
MWQKRKKAVQKAVAIRKKLERLPTSADGAAVRLAR